MRVLIGAFGTRGDVQPMLALSEALLARGHSVSLAVPPSSLDHARESVPGAFAVGMGYEEISRLASSGKTRDLLSTASMARGQIAVQLEALEGPAAEVDLIAGASVISVGSMLGERLGKPYAFFLFCPQMLPSGDHPNPSVRSHGWPRWMNRLSWKTNEWVWSRLILAPVNQARVSRGLPPVRRIWPELISSNPILACDPALAGGPSDWPGSLPQPGALFAPERASLSPEVAAFLERGPPPVYVGFGSMSDPKPRDTTARILEAVRRAGVRALVARGWAGLGPEEAPAPEEVLFIDPEPHGKLFPRCAAVVHHGGAGTTHVAARAGVPQVLMPHLLDQFFWAHRVAVAGIGPRAVSRYARDPEPLARAIRACVEDAALRERAREVGARIAPDGAERAVQVLERLVELAPRRGGAH